MIAIFEFERDGLLVSTDPVCLQLDLVDAWLQETYWAGGMPRTVLEKAIAHSLPLGVYRNGAQMGFARIVTDYATYAYFTDVVIAPEARGQGAGKALMAAAMAHPELQNLRRWALLTHDAHGLYEQFGFRVSGTPERYMEIIDPDVYARSLPKTASLD